MNAGPTIRAILYAAPARSGEESRPIDLQSLGDPFETTLEEALAAIERQPRGFVEPDGSFALHAEAEAEEGSGARIDGEVYDFVAPGVGSRVHHVDVRGPAVTRLWRTVFHALSPLGAEGVMVFLPDAGEALFGEAFLARIGAK